MLVDRYEGAGNLTGNNERTGLFTIMALQSVMRREPSLTPSQRQACLAELGRQHFWRGYEYFLAGRFAPARQHLRSAVEADPTHDAAATKLLRWMRLPTPVVKSHAGITGADALSAGREAMCQPRHARQHKPRFRAVHKRQRQWIHRQHQQNLQKRM